MVGNRYEVKMKSFQHLWQIRLQTAKPGVQSQHRHRFKSPFVQLLENDGSQKNTHFAKKTMGIWCGRWVLIKTNTCRKFSGTIPPESRKEITLTKTNVNNVIKIFFSSTYNHQDHGRCHHRKYDKYVWAKVRATIYITTFSIIINAVNITLAARKSSAIFSRTENFG